MASVLCAREGSSFVRFTDLDAKNLYASIVSQVKVGKPVLDERTLVAGADPSGGLYLSDLYGAKVLSRRRRVS